MLRRAAAKIRDAAKDAPTGPWWHDSVTGEVRQEQCCPDDEEGGQVVAIGNWGPSDPALAHIALWSPDVAALVADVLDQAAERYDDTMPTAKLAALDRHYSDRFALARRILGEDS